MTRPTRNNRPEIDPRGWTQEEVAAYLGWSINTFRTRKSELERRGFPAIDPLLGRYDRKAIEAWFDNRSGLKKMSEVEQAEAMWLAQINGQSAA